MMLSELLKRLGEIYSEKGELATNIVYESNDGNSDIELGMVRDVWVEDDMVVVGKRRHSDDDK